jgi:hypothetical protein
MCGWTAGAASRDATDAVGRKDRTTVSNYRVFGDLPEDIRDYVRQLDQPDLEAWIRQPIPPWVISQSWTL